MTAQTEAKTEASREPQVGDVVHVRVQLTRVKPDELWLRLPCGAEFWCRPSDIVHIEPAPLKVGDRVTWGTKIYDGELIAIRGEYGFVDMGGYAAKEPLRDLTRIDGDAR